MKKYIFQTFYFLGGLLVAKRAIVIKTMQNTQQGKGTLIKKKNTSIYMHTKYICTLLYTVYKRSIYIPPPLREKSRKIEVAATTETHGTNRLKQVCVCVCVFLFFVLIPVEKNRLQETGRYTQHLEHICRRRMICREAAQTATFTMAEY